MILKRVGPMSCAKVAGILYALVGLVVGFFATIIALLGAVIGASSHAGGAMFGMFFGVGSIILLPIFYVVLGFICTYIMALLYNKIVGYIGGIELDFEPTPGATEKEFQSPGL